MDGKKILIAYYSYSGNTKSISEKIQKIVGGDLFEIIPIKDYPRDYNEVVSLAKVEKVNDVRPELAAECDLSVYDIIFVGTPVWWYTMASPMKTFLTKYNYDGKIVIPFCTHGGGGASNTYTDIKSLLPNSRILDGFTVYENSATIDDIRMWIEKLGILNR